MTSLSSRLLCRTFKNERDMKRLYIFNSWLVSNVFGLVGLTYLFEEGVDPVDGEDEVGGGALQPPVPPAVHAQPARDVPAHAADPVPEVAAVAAADGGLGCNSIDILSFGHKAGCKTGPGSGTTSVIQTSPLTMTPAGPGQSVTVTKLSL